MIHSVIISPMIPDRTSTILNTIPSILLTALLLSGCQDPANLPTQEGFYPQQGSAPQNEELLPGSSTLGEEYGSDVLQAAISTSADTILNAINLRRTQAGLLPWLVEPTLVDYAYERSVDMAIRGYLDHIVPGEEQVQVIPALQDGDYYGQAAELVFATQDSLQNVASVTLAAWFDDPDHEALLMSPLFRYVGLGVMGDGSQWIVTLILVEGRSS
jgi:uncharacterized protein YkwD